MPEVTTVLVLLASLFVLAGVGTVDAVAAKKISDLTIFPEDDYSTPLLHPVTKKPMKDGGGACGAVWFRKDKNNREVAIKVVTDFKELQFVMNEIFILELLKERKIPNVLRMREAYRAANNKAVYIVTNYIRGEMLKTMLKRAENGTDGGWNPSEEDIANIFGQLVTTLWHFNELKLIHRDLKPDNVMISRVGDKYTLTVIDFGFAQIVTKKEIKDYVGTPTVMAPEVLREMPQDMRADQWSAFILLVMMFSRTRDALFEHICTRECRPDHEDIDDIDVARAIDEIQISNMTSEYTLPSSMPEELQQLTRQVFQLDVSKRPSINRIMKNPWFEKWGVKFPDDKRPKPIERRPSELPQPPAMEPRKRAKRKLKYYGRSGRSSTVMQSTVASRSRSRQPITPQSNSTASPRFNTIEYMRRATPRSSAEDISSSGVRTPPLYFRRTSSQSPMFKDAAMFEEPESMELDEERGRKRTERAWSFTTTPGGRPSRIPVLRPSRSRGGLIGSALESLPDDSDEERGGLMNFSPPPPVPRVPERFNTGSSGASDISPKTRVGAKPPVKKHSSSDDSAALSAAAQQAQARTRSARRKNPAGSTRDKTAAMVAPSSKSKVTPAAPGAGPRASKISLASSTAPATSSPLNKNTTARAVSNRAGHRKSSTRGSNSSNRQRNSSRRSGTSASGSKQT